MKNKLKNISSLFIVVIIILYLGFAPIRPETVFSFDWESMGAKMTEAGVIDKEKFENLHNGESFSSAANNSRMSLNMLWAFGLGNKNPILENGLVMDKNYGGAGNFEFKGGWTLAQGNAMDH